ncbi:MAG: PKD domain-containing protein, partial [Saprospiraceae bacterium]
PTVLVTGMAGTYQILVEAVNQFGCRASEQTPVTFLPAGSVDGDINVKNCGGLTVNFENLGAVTGTWNFGDLQTSNVKNPEHTYSLPGAYTVTFTPDADCYAPFDTLVQIQLAPLVPAGITSSLGNCADTAVYTLMAMPATGNYSWQWLVDGQTSNQQNPTFTFSQSGLVQAYLTVTDVATGCVGMDTLPVDVHVIKDKIGPDTMICLGTAVQLNPGFTPSNSTYQWTASPADPSLTNPSSPNPTVNPSVSTVYTVVITNGDCAVQYAKTVNPQGSVVIDLGSDRVVCSDDPVTLAVMNPVGNNYEWSQTQTFNIIIGQGNTIKIVPEKNGVYYVRTTGGADCAGFGEIHVDNAKVLVDALPKDPNVCLGESAQLTITNLNAGDILQYSWSGGLDAVPNPVIAPTSATTYSVTVTNQAGCKDTLDFNVSVTALAVTAQVTGKDTLCPGQSTTLLATAVGTGTFTYSWTPAETLTGANTANPTARPDAETVYTVTATADGLCPQTASVTIYFMGDQCVEPSIFVPKAFTPNRDGNNDFFIVRGVNIKELYMVVWDRWGEKVYETNDTQAQGWDGTYDGGSLTPDAYAWYVKATCGNGAVYEKKGNVTLLK